MDSARLRARGEVNRSFFIKGRAEVGGSASFSDFDLVRSLTALDYTFEDGRVGTTVLDGNHVPDVAPNLRSPCMRYSTLTSGTWKLGLLDRNCGGGVCCRRHLRGAYMRRRIILLSMLSILCAAFSASRADARAVVLLCDENGDYGSCCWGAQDCVNWCDQNCPETSYCDMQPSTMCCGAGGFSIWCRF